MNAETDEKRMKQIYAMLMEMGSGNFKYRLKRTEMKDEIEAITALVNMTAEELHASPPTKGHMDQNKTYGNLMQLFFILDKKEIVMAFNPMVKEVLSFDDDELMAKPFHSLLAPESKKAWKSLKARSMRTDQGSHKESIQLSLRTKQDLILTTNFTVGKVMDGTDKPGRTIVASMEMTKMGEERESHKSVGSGSGKDSTGKVDLRANYRKGPINLRNTDIRKIRAVRDYILKNLHGSLPSIKEMANSFGTNEYKLKHGFKRLYGQTVANFTINERLRKAGVLVEESDIRIKQIANLTGFKNCGHFSRVFKAKYGLNPTDLRKRSK